MTELIGVCLAGAGSLTATLPGAVMSQAAAMSASRQQVFLAGRRLLASWLQARYGLDVLPPMTYGEHGRPHFIDPALPDFNLSHSGDWLWLAVGAAPLGLDIEVLRPRRQLDKLMAHILSTDEQAWVKVQSDPLAAFYALWTVREAVLKASGRGLAGLGQLQVLPRVRQLLSVAVPPGELWQAEWEGIMLALYQPAKDLPAPKVYRREGAGFVEMALPWLPSWTVSAVG